MPKQVDHEERRALIADAVLRIIVAQGLDAVSLRHVAAEAGISMGAVQHYFRSKDDMLFFALDHMSRQREERVAAAVRAQSDDPTPQVILRASVNEVLPSTEHRRGEWLVGVAFFVRSLTDPPTAEYIAKGMPLLHRFFADMIGTAMEAGDTRAGIDPEHESVILWSLLESQGGSVALGERTMAEAMSTVDYHLNGLFPGGADA